MQKRLRKSITKTIAAFLNTDGGTLLIGVDDSGQVLGIEPDFEYLKQGKQDADGWRLSLKDVIINALGAEACSTVHVSLVPTDRKQSQSSPVLLARARPGTVKTPSSSSTYGRRTRHMNCAVRACSGTSANAGLHDPHHRLGRVQAAAGSGHPVPHTPRKARAKAPRPLLFRGAPARLQLRELAMNGATDPWDRPR